METVNVLERQKPDPRGETSLQDPMGFQRSETIRNWGGGGGGEQLHGLLAVICRKHISSETYVRLEQILTSFMPISPLFFVIFVMTQMHVQQHKY